LAYNYSHMNQTNRKIETLKIFPYIAWTTVILFALFVYNLTVETREALKNLEYSVSQLESKVNTPVNEIEDFEGSAPTFPPTETTPDFTL
jgi:hypothetical protein